MRYYLRNRFVLSAVLACCIGTVSSAQEGRYESEDYPEGPSVRNFAIPPGSPEALPPKTEKELSDAVTDLIVIELNEAAAFCGRVKRREYIVDCLAYEYTRIAAALPSQGEYSAVKKGIEQAAVKLENVVAENRSKALPAGRLAQGGPEPRRTVRAIRPVATAALPTTTAKAVEIIQETQTVLIRSTENSEERRRQFQRIVSAMDTGTILLRSI